MAASGITVNVPARDRELAVVEEQLAPAAPKEELSVESTELFRRGDEARVALEQTRRGGAGLRLLTWDAAGWLARR